MSPIGYALFVESGICIDVAFRQSEFSIVPVPKSYKSDTKLFSFKLHTESKDLEIAIPREVSRRLWNLEEKS